MGAYGLWYETGGIVPLMSPKIVPILVGLAMPWPVFAQEPEEAPLAATAPEDPEAVDPVEPIVEPPVIPIDATQYYVARRSFAEHLQLEGDFYRAIGVLKELAFYSREPAIQRELYLRIAAIYEQAKRWESAAMTHEALASLTTDPELAAHDRLMAVYNLMRAEMCGDALGAIRLIQRQLPAGADHTSAELTGRLRFAASLSEIYMGRFEEGVALARRVPSDHSLFSASEDLLAILDEELPLSFKSPVLAGVLSVVPGLGHLYIGDPLAALTALVWNGLFVVATCEALYKELYLIGSLVGILELLWYGGTIYGAVNLATRHNYSVRERLAKEIFHQGSSALLER